MEANHKRNSIFDWIAPVYGMFFNYQKRQYKKILNKKLVELGLSQYKNIIDVGCGTGALCSVLKQVGLRVTGVDASRKMLQIAAKKQGNEDIEFVHASILERMPFGDQSFDIAIASFVAHGFPENSRYSMYAEMSRIARCLVIINDYNKKRSPFVDLIEGLEGGDYFNFIKKSQGELNKVFGDVRIIPVGSRSACYICRPLAQYKENS